MFDLNDDLYDDSDDKYEELIYNKFDEIQQRKITKDDFTFSCMTKIVGLSFNTTKEFILNNIHSGDYLDVERERENKYDSNALAIYCNNIKIGYVSKDIAHQLMYHNNIEFIVSEITGISLNTNNVGINGKILATIC